VGQCRKDRFPGGQGVGGRGGPSQPVLGVFTQEVVGGPGRDQVLFLGRGVGGGGGGCHNHQVHKQVDFGVADRGKTKYQ